jgi:hypothetical protein
MIMIIFIYICNGGSCHYQSKNKVDVKCQPAAFKRENI